MDHHCGKRFGAMLLFVYVLFLQKKRSKKAYLVVYLHPGLTVLGPMTKYDIAC